MQEVSSSPLAMESVNLRWHSATLNLTLSCPMQSVIIHLQTGVVQRRPSTGIPTLVAMIRARLTYTVYVDCFSLDNFANKRQIAVFARIQEPLLDRRHCRITSQVFSVNNI